jgi:uncharacterized protein involved in type VI secretion and phage assembly
VTEVDLLGLLSGRAGLVSSAADDRRRRIDGITLGVVSDIDDPLSLGRVKVRLPWLSEQAESAWAQLVLPWAGSKRGTYFVPEVDDEVVVAFRHGDVRHPYVLGCMWSTTARPPEADPRLERRGLASKSGHKLVFDDTKGSEQIELTSKAGTTVTLDDSGSGKVTVANKAKTVKLELDFAQGAISITSSAGNITLSAPSGKVAVDAASFEVKTTGPLQLQSSATVTVQGSLVKIN